MIRTTRWLLGLVVVLTLMAAACTIDAPGLTTSVEPTTTTTTTAPPPTTTTAAPDAATTTTTMAPEPLVVWSDEQHAEALRQIAEAHAAVTGIGVDVVVKDFATIRNDAIQEISNGAGPDLFLGDHDWTGELARAGLITRIDDMPDVTRSGLHDSALAAFTFDGARYGLPFEFESVAMWMNTTLARTTEAPADFEAVRTVCDITIDESEGQLCFAMSGGADSLDPYHLFPFTSAYGGSIFTYDPEKGYIPNRAGIARAASIAGNSFMRDLTSEEYMPTMNYQAAETAFTEGRAVFWITGPWAEQTIRDGSASSGFEYQVAPIPLMEGGQAKPFVDARGFYLSASSVRERDAKNLLYYFIGVDDGMALLSEAGSALPAHRRVAQASDDPVTRSFVDSAATGQPTPNVPEMTSEVWEAWGVALNEIRNGTATVEDALAKGAAVINTLLGS